MTRVVRLPFERTAIKGQKILPTAPTHQIKRSELN